MDKRTERFLTYLDKEGTVLGLLSGFCLAVLALVWKALGDAQAGSLFDQLQGEWISFCLILAGSVSLLVAGLLFYLQRSLLCLGTSESEAGRTQLTDWREQIRGGWRRYHLGFALMVLGFVFLIGALVPLLLVKVGGNTPGMVQVPPKPLQPTQAGRPFGRLEAARCGPHV
jgi:hypothetical protein